MSAVVRTRMRPVLGTLCAVEAAGDGNQAESGIAAAFQELQWIERLLHPHREGSDVNMIANSVGQPVTVNPATWELLQWVKSLHEFSDGAFDPCRPDAVGDFDDIELHEPMTVICHRKVIIDLGGVAKGYAVDRAVTALKAAGCRNGMVNAGGDVCVFGDEHRRMQLRITDRDSCAVVLHDNALAVSDGRAANHPQEFQWYYSRTPQHSVRFKQAAILAPSTAVADALTKCALICSDDCLTGLLQRFNATLVMRG
jgi:FAD:protein FMN transferase